MPPRGGEKSRGPKGPEKLETPKVLAETLEKELEGVDFYYGEDISDNQDLAERFHDEGVVNAVEKLSDIEKFSSTEQLTNWVEAAHRLGMIEIINSQDVDQGKLKMKEDDDTRMVFQVGPSAFLALPKDSFEGENTPEDAKRMLKNQLALQHIQHRTRVLKSGVGDIAKGNQSIDQVINGMREVPGILKSELKNQLKPKEIIRNHTVVKRIPNFDDAKKSPINENGRRIREGIIRDLSEYQTPQEESQIRELASDLKSIKGHELATKHLEAVTDLEIDEEQEKLKAEQAEIEGKATEELRAQSLASKVQKIYDVKGDEVEADWEKMDGEKVESKHDKKSRILGIVTRALDLDDQNQPNFGGLESGVRVLQMNLPKMSVETFQQKAIELLIHKEIAGKEYEFSFSFDRARSVIESISNIDVKNLENLLSQRDLGDFYYDLFVAHRELFEPNVKLTEAQEKEHDKLLSEYTNKSKGNVLEKISNVDLMPEMPYGEIQNFLMSKDPSIQEIMRFLNGREFSAFAGALYIGTEGDPDGFIKHFDEDGKPIDDVGESLRATYLGYARERAGDNEYLAIEKEVNEKYGDQKYGIGGTIDGACQGYVHAINQLGGTVVRDEEGRIVKVKHNRHWRERWTQKEDVSKITGVGDLLKELEGFRRNYKRELGEYFAEARDFQRIVQEKLDGLPEGEDLDPRERARIRKRALQIRLAGLHVNRLARDEINSMTSVKEEKEKPRHPKLVKAMGDNVQEFLKNRIQDETGWERPVKLDTLEQREKYDAIMAEEKKRFVETMIAKTQEQPGEYGAYQVIANAAQNNDPAEMRRLINEFNNENSAGLLEFAAEVSYMEKILRQDLKSAVGAGEVTKIIDLLNAQDMHDTLKIDRLRKFDQVAKRYSSKERWRQRYEKALKTISGNPNAKLNKWEQVSEFFEKGKGPISFTYKGGVWTKTSVLNSFNRAARAGLATRTFYNNTVDFFLPSERTRKKIDRDVARRSILFSNRIERNVRLKRLRSTQRGDWLFSLTNEEQLERVTARARA